MINLKKRPVRVVERVLFPLIVTMWRFQFVNRAGFDFCAYTSAGNIIETGVTPLRSGGVMVSRTLYRNGIKSEYTDVTKFTVAGLVSWARNVCALGGTLRAGTFYDQPFSL